MMAARAMFVLQATTARKGHLGLHLVHWGRIVLVYGMRILPIAFSVVWESIAVIST